MDNKKGYNPDFVKEMEEIKKQKTIRISGYDDLYDEGDVLEEEEKS